MRVEPRGELLLGPHAGRDLGQRRAVQRQVQRLARRASRTAPVRRALPTSSATGAGEHQPLGAAAGGDAAVDRCEQRYDEAVLGRGAVVDGHLDARRGALQPADQQVRHVDAEPVAVVVGPERQRVGQHQGAVVAV